MSNANRTPALAIESFRPAIAEAKLLNEKHAGNVAYVAALAGELDDIEQKLCALEAALDLAPPAESVSARPGPSACHRDVRSIREKSGELDQRLRSIRRCTQRPRRLSG